MHRSRASARYPAEGLPIALQLSSCSSVLTDIAVRACASRHRLPLPGTAFRSFSALGPAGMACVQSVFRTADLATDGSANSFTLFPLKSKLTTANNSMACSCESFCVTARTVISPAPPRGCESRKRQKQAVAQPKSPNRGDSSLYYRHNWNGHEAAVTDSGCCAFLPHQPSRLTGSRCNCSGGTC
jgi:hypothetical protein